MARRRARRSTLPGAGRSGVRQARALLRALMPPARTSGRTSRAASTKTASTKTAATKTAATKTAATKAASGRTSAVGRAAKAAKTARGAPSTSAPHRPGGRGTWYAEHHRGLAGGRPYAVYVPPGLRRGSRVPLLVALHGCTQTPAEFAALTRFNQLADRHRFVVAYPEQTAWSHRNRCWHWYDAAHQSRGVGEPAILASITRHVAAEATRWRIDPTRVYVAGLSAGGGMALVLAATYPDVYAAVAVHSAPAYRSATTGRQAFAAMAARRAVPPPRPQPPTGGLAAGIAAGSTFPAARRLGGMPPAIVVQGSDDPTVDARNGERVTTQWLAHHRLRHADPADPDRVTRSRTATGRTTRGRRWTRVRWYTAGRRPCLEYWLVDGLRHAWSGGASGVAYSDPQGPRASTVIWAFLARHALPADP